MTKKRWSASREERASRFGGSIIPQVTMTISVSTKDPARLQPSPMAGFIPTEQKAPCTVWIWPAARAFGQWMPGQSSTHQKASLASPAGRWWKGTPFYSTLVDATEAASWRSIRPTEKFFGRRLTTKPAIHRRSRRQLTAGATFSSSRALVWWRRLRPTEGFCSNFPFDHPCGTPSALPHRWCWGM